MKITPAKLLLSGLGQADDTPISGVITDSRGECRNAVFVCFPGQRVDGHRYAAQVYEKGAAYVVANHPVEGVPADRVILCPDSRTAMLQMGSNYRAQFRPKMIGVTGSVGKTTTKEFCYAILSAFGNTIKTEGNQNNEIGVPNTLFRIQEDTEYAVVEMGMSHPNEIDALVRAARPQAGLITCIGVSHIENLGSRENILKAKLEICNGLPEGAPLALNADDDMLVGAVLPGHVRPIWYGIRNRNADVRAENIVQTEQGMNFQLVDRENGTFEVAIPTLGLHTVYDALAAYTAATRMGLEAGRCAAALSDYQSTGMRQHILKRKDVTVVEDCYNASPDSMLAALEMFRTLPAKRHIALLGDMLELGAISTEAHTTVGRWAAEKGVDLLVAYGPQSAKMAQETTRLGGKAIHCTQAEEAARILEETLREGDALLAKASRGMALETILERWYEA